ncbi:heterokaryon incompatibility protein-domain-containing protein, partial [Paraphoma chrysanthemicola]
MALSTGSVDAGAGSNTGTDSGGPLFEHRPLDLRATTLRLVEILKPGPDGGIRCKMKHFTMTREGSNTTGVVHESIPQYTCLSYVWGSPDDKRWITIDDRPFEIRRNLWDFLHPGVAPQLDFEQCAQSLWIDALSIDQSNMSERNHQVQQMGWIYSNAVHVVSWLGNDPMIAELFRFAAVDDSRERYNEPSFHRNEYWRRAWITQEIYLARKWYLLVKGVLIPASAIVQAAKTMKYPGRKPYRVLDDVVSKLFPNHDISRTVLENFKLCSRKQCSDPRDLVYSLLSISSDGAKLLVDYGCSMIELAKHVL